MSFTIGQIFYATNNGSNGSATEGIQQPFEILMIDALDDPFGFTLQCSAYPNPTIDFLTLKVENYNNENISFQLYDLSGILIQNKKLEGNETHISMNHLVPATYFLKVVENKKEIKTFKIIKH